jgi:6,7-dimethyl-8-ribityllumazine synthase
MPKSINGHLSAKGKKFGLVVGRFNEFISNKVITGAVDCIVRNDGNEDDVTVAWVPGSYEIPLIAKKMAESKKYDAVICLGAVIRGATPHFDYIAAEVTKGVAHVGLGNRCSGCLRYITSDTIEQAIERAGTKSGNKGWDAAQTAIEMVDLLGKL